MEKTDKIFEYSIGWCWWTTYTIKIFDKKENNTVLKREPFFIAAPNQKNTERTITLPEEKIEELKEIINKNPEIFTIWEIEFPPVCDWDWGSFFFSNGIKIKKGEFSNLWYYEWGEDTYRDYKKWIVTEARKVDEAKNAKILIKVLNQIFKTLKWEKIAHKFLQYWHE